MITISQRQTKQAATPLDHRIVPPGELDNVSDRVLRDIGLSRSRSRAVDCNPFWMP